MLLLLLLQSTAIAAECPERITPEAWTADMREQVELAALALPEVNAELDKLETWAACVDGPLETSDIASLWLARGAREVIAEEIGPSTLSYFVAAKGIGGEAAWNPIYGQTAERWFRDAKLPAVPSTLTVYLPHDVLVIDGVVVYEPGPHPLTAGPHLIQWSDASGWHGQWQPLESGQNLIWGEPPRGGPDPMPPGVPKKAPDKPPGTPWHFEAGVAFGTTSLSGAGELPNPEGTPFEVSGRDGGPRFSAEVRASHQKLWFGLAAVGGLAPTQQDIAWPYGFGASAGLNWSSPRMNLAAGVGPRLLRAPDLDQIDPGLNLPIYANRRAPAAAALLDARVGQSLGLRARTEWTVGPQLISGEVSAGPSLRLGKSAQLELNAAAGWTQLGGSAPLSMLWWSATGGTRWSF